MPSTEVHQLQPHATNGVMGAFGVGNQAGELWGDCDLLRLYLDPTYAYHEWDDFHKFDATDDWTLTNATSGTGDVIAGVGGILELDAAAATADQGVQIQKKAANFTLAADKDLWFECRFKITDTIAGCQVFAGLSILDTTMFAVGIPTHSNYIGWSLDAVQQAATASTMQFELNSTAGSAEPAGGVNLLVEDTFVRLGFKVNGITSVQPFVNGVRRGDLLTIADEPTGAMSISFLCQEEGGSVDPIMSLDWYRAVQLR